MVKFDPQITKLLEERSRGFASEDTAAKELIKLTGLELDVAKAFCRGWSTSTPPEIRGYRKEFICKPKKK